MRRSALAAWLTLLAAGSAAAEPPSKPAATGFGTPIDTPFTPANVFPATKPEPPPPPVVVVEPGIGEGADGGLLPERVAPRPKYWSGSIDTGLNGSSGNSELFNFRASAAVRRKTADNSLTGDFLYTYTESNNVTTVQQALFNARDECLIAGTPWSIFAATNVEYDELRVYKFRVGQYAGLSYTFLDAPHRTFKVRAGAGAVRELGSDGAPNRWVPEALLGYDFKQRLGDRASMFSTLDFYPRIDDPEQFRLRFRFGYEHVLDPVNCVVMRLGLQERYDTNPGNARRGDLTYFMTLGMKF